MNFRFPCPLSECLSLIPKNNARQAPENHQRHIRHDWRDVSALLDPRGDEFREPVAPDILVHRYGDEDRTCDRFVGIDSVGRRDGWESRYLDAGTSVADYHDDLLKNEPRQ